MKYAPDIAATVKALVRMHSAHNDVPAARRTRAKTNPKHLMKSEPLPGRAATRVDCRLYP